VARRQVDERQAAQRLQVQALVGRVMGLAVAYSIAVATGSALWLYGILLGVLVLSLLAGWLRYGEHGGRRGAGNDDQGWSSAPRS
jgi:hypothetical protein